MPDEKLLSCPFCGEDKAVVSARGIGHLVECRKIDCLAEGPHCITQGDAITAWNTRIASETRAQPADMGDRSMVAAIWYSAIRAYTHDDIGEQDDQAAIDDLGISIAALSTSPTANERLAEAEALVLRLVVLSDGDDRQATPSNLSQS